jgi:hypothetical protein
MINFEPNKKRKVPKLSARRRSHTWIQTQEESRRNWYVIVYWRVFCVRGLWCKFCAMMSQLWVICPGFCDVPFLGFRVDEFDFILHLAIVHVQSGDFRGAGVCKLCISALKDKDWAFSPHLSSVSISSLQLCEVFNFVMSQCGCQYTNTWSQQTNENILRAISPREVRVALYVLKCLCCCCCCCWLR